MTTLAKPLIGLTAMLLCAAVVAADEPSRWTLERGSLVQHDVRTAGTHADFGDVAWRDYEFTLEAKKTGGNEGFLVVVRAVDDKNHYFWNLGGWGNREHGLQVRQDGRRDFVGQRVVADPIETGRWYKIRVRVAGDRIEGFLDDRKLLDVRDKTFAVGRVGVGTWRTTAQFRNLRVSSLDGQVLLDGAKKLSGTDDVALVGGDTPRAPQAAGPPPFVPVLPDVKRAYISVDAKKVLHPIDRRIIGSNIEDLNYQCYGGVYSQLLHGECFEEHVDPREALGLTGPARLAIYVCEHEGEPRLTAFQGRGWDNRLARQLLGIAPGGTDPVAGDELQADMQKAFLDATAADRQISRQWHAVIDGSAKGVFRFVRQGTFNGTQSQGVTFASGDGEVGVDNAGLNRNGINLVKGKPYEGLLRIRAEQDATVYVSLRTADGSVLAEEPIELDCTSGEYRPVEFTLVPTAGDGRGRLAVTLKEPGSIVLGYAFLQPGEWGRFQGLPLRKELVQAVVDQGVKVMRYNGSMVNRCPDGHLYKWKEMIGPRDLRRPYHGWFNPYASHGFAIFEFLDMCRAAGFLAVPGVRIDETAEEMAQFVEYAIGPTDSEWGRPRVEDGHPEPYQLTHLQIGNEEKLDEHYVERFIALGRAIWSKDPTITLVVSQNLSSRAADWIVGPEGQIGDQLELARQIVAFGADAGGPIWWDCHYRGRDLREVDDPNGRIVAMGHLRESIRQMLPDYHGFKLAPLEENGTDNHHQRGLVHARNLHAFMRMGDLPAVAVANTFQADGQNIVWDQGRTMFNASQVWFQPPYYVDQMVYQSPASKVVATDFASPRAALDAVARIDDDGRTLVLQVVNIEPDPVETELSIDGFTPGSPTAEVIQLSSQLDEENTAAEPTRVAPTRRDWRHEVVDGKTTFVFEPYSFTLIRFASPSKGR